MRATMHGLGLRGPGSSVVVSNTPSFRGAIKKVHPPRARRGGRSMADTLEQAREARRAPPARRRASAAAWAPASARRPVAARRVSTRARAGSSRTSRAGRRPLQRRLPKRGFRNPFPTITAEVNVGDLDVFAAGREGRRSGAPRARPRQGPLRPHQGPRQRRADQGRHRLGARVLEVGARPRSRRRAARSSSCGGQRPSRSASA